MIRSILGVSFGWLGLSMVADGVPSLLLPHQLLSGGRGATDLGVMSFLAVGAAAVVQPFAGAWSDRVGRLPVVAGGAAVAVVGIVLVAVPQMALAGAVLALAGASVAQAGYQALLPDRLPVPWHGRGAGAKGVFDLAGAFLAFALLAALLGGGLALPAALAMAAVLLASLGLGFVLLRSRTAPFDAAPTDAGAAGSLASVIAARFAFLFGIYAVGRFLVFFTADRLGLDADAAAAAAGTLLAVLTLANAAAAIPAGWLTDRVGRAPIMLAGSLLAMAGIGLMPLAGSQLQMIGLGMIIALGSAAFGVGSWATLADVSAGPASGRKLGIANLGTAGAAALAGLIGIVIDAGESIDPGSGYVVAFSLAAAATLAGGVIGFRSAVSGGRTRTSLEVIG